MSGLCLDIYEHRLAKYCPNLELQPTHSKQVSPEMLAVDLLVEKTMRYSYEGNPIFARQLAGRSIAVAVMSPCKGLCVFRAASAISSSLHTA